MRQDTSFFNEKREKKEKNWKKKNRGPAHNLNKPSPVYNMFGFADTGG